MRWIRRRPGIVGQFARYATIGALNVAFYFVLFNAFLLLGAPTLVANAIAFFITSVNSYVLNKRWAFRDTQPRVVRQYFVFVGFTLVGLALNTAVLSALLIPLEGYGTTGKNLAALGALPVSVIWNFTSYRRWTFSRRADAAEASRSRPPSGG